VRESKIQGRFMAKGKDARVTVLYSLLVFETNGVNKEGWGFTARGIDYSNKRIDTIRLVDWN